MILVLIFFILYFNHLIRNFYKNLLNILFFISNWHFNKFSAFNKLTFLILFYFCEHVFEFIIFYSSWCFFNNINYTYLWFLSFFSHISVNFLTNFYNKSIKSLIYWILIHFIDFFRIKLTKFYSVTFFFHAFILIITFGSFNRFLFFVNWWNVLNRR